MFISPGEVLNILEHYKYFLIFPIAIVEGPIIVIITGFLVYLGYLNGIIAYSVIVIADVIGDSLYYSIGRFWKKSVFAKKVAGFLGYSESNESFLEEHFKKHKGKTFLIAKISHGVGGAVQVSSGIAGVKYRDFIFYSFIGTVPKALALFFIGYYFGSSYIKIDDYFNFWAKITFLTITLIFSYFVALRYAKKYFSRKSNGNN